MYIYNLTINVEENIHDEWRQWMEQQYIPEMLATKKFNKASLNRLLAKQQQGITYAVQFESPNRATLKQYYIENHSKMIQRLQRFKDQIVFFGTEMEVVHERS